jgi:hypothetical protein
VSESVRIRCVLSALAGADAPFELRVIDIIPQLQTCGAEVESASVHLLISLLVITGAYSAKPVQLGVTTLEPQQPTWANVGQGDAPSQPQRHHSHHPSFPKVMPIL